MPGKKPAKYLRPYVDAIERHGGGFEALLWTSPQTQALRFAAMCQIYDFSNKSVVDVGCGRADFLDYLIGRNIPLDHYVGLEAIDQMAAAAELKHHRHCTIVRADFVTEPSRMFVGADVAVFCGSLNTLSTDEFYQTLRRALDAASEAVVFNFLSSPKLAGAKFLTWHKTEKVAQFLIQLGARITTLSDYYDGDCTIAAIRA